MALFHELLTKLARGEKLSPGELSSFDQEAKFLDDVLHTVKAWQGSNNKIDPRFIDFPVDDIFSSVLTEDLSTLPVVIPGIYKHLFIYGSGRTTGSGTGTENLLCRFNDDDATDYSTQKLTVSNTTVTAARDTSQQQTIIGGLGQGGRAAEDSISFVAFIPFANGPSLFKTSFALVGPAMFLYFGNWTLNPPARIETITFIPGADSIAAGSVISVFGVV